ncbi:hypothetical protein GCM10022239_03340 [Leifsonia bigeumensis]|uniref:Fibronectin type-III domain-containing protein n=1 Tax=Leifsonella bigeumensis TaxID=433643 RepID=A0ABP7F5K3_9MICO
MPTYEASYPSKSSWKLRLVVTESNLDAVANTSDVTEALYMVRGDGSTPWINSGTGYSVGGPAGGSGDFPAYDFEGIHSGTDYSATPTGGAVLIFSSTQSVVHDADGSKSFTVSASHAAAATLGTASISSKTVTLTKLTQVPGTPTGVTATRVSDTQTTVAWTNNDAANGARTGNKVQQSVNGGAYADAATIAPASSVVVSTAVNRKTVYKVNASNSAGTSAYSIPSAPIYTTPAAPSGVSAAKNASLDVVVVWTDNVAFTEHTHKVETASSSDGGASWSAWSTLTSAGSGGTYTHAAPDAAKLWKYRVTAVNSDTAALASSAVESNTVQLLAAPNKPTLPALGPFVDKAAAFVVPWTHNPVDTTPQTAYEVGYSTDGGGVWSTTGKVASTTSSKSFAASTYAADVALTVRVRTWGEATTGGADGTGASPWSDLATVTVKTRPVVTITAPVDAGTWTEAELTVELGFSQAEGATFVSATISLYEGVTLLEQLASTTLASTVMDTRVANGGSYTVKVTGLDSNGLTSALVESDFTVAYTEPVTASVTATYLEDSGIGQLEVTIPTAGVGEADAVSVSITRTIDGATETVFTDYPTEPVLTLLDLTPTIHGDNLYTVTTKSADGATAEVQVTMTTTEDRWAFLSKGADFTDIVAFSANLKFGSTPTVDSALLKASGRSRPIGLYGTGGDLVVSGTVDIFEDDPSTPEEIEAFLLLSGKACYRDPSGRRMFGQVAGAISRENSALASLSYSITETS